MFRFASCVAFAAMATSLFAAAPKNLDDDKGTAIGGNDLEWSIVPSPEPVKCFAPVTGYMWFATPSKVIAMGTKKKDIQEFLKLGNFDAATASCMAADAAGNVWIGTAEGVAVRKGAAFVTYTVAQGLPADAVNAISIGKDGKVWVATAGGAARFDGTAWTAFTSKNGLPSDEATAILADDGGKVWVGTNKGIGCYNGTSWTVYNMKNGLSWNNVHAFGYDTRKQQLWAAVGESDINTYDGKAWKVYMSIQPGITSIMADTQSRIWFGFEGGLVKFNGEEWITDAEKIGLTLTQVTSMLRDAVGNMYFGTDKGVVKLLNPYPY